jgi:DNA primase
MARFDPGVTREIHARIDIATFVGQYVALKRRGRDLVGLCPFHAEKTPSFHVHPDEGYFMCFGCGAGGDVISFVQRLENVPFPEAVRILAKRAGIEVAAEDPRAARTRSEREAIYEANGVAAAYFHRMFSGDLGAPARAYCERRGFGEAIVERFHLGYAPDAWDGLVEDLRKNGVDLAIAQKAGLVKAGQRQASFYDFYRARLMVPTYATTGEVIAFGGRLLGEGEPKYLNTTTTPVYTKGEHLFGLNVARRAAQSDRTLIVVEGYLDCIALHQAGFENAVAALGTSFTARQAAELHKYAERVFLCFDGDAAGNAAATKAVDTASNVIEHAGSSVRVVLMPDGEDPDSYIRSKGAGAFRILLDAAKPSIEFKIDQHVDRLKSGFDSPAAIVRKAEAIVRELTPREEWDRWRVYVAGRLKVNVDDLRNSRFLANNANFAPRTHGNGRSGSRYVQVHGKSANALLPMSFEREVLCIVLEDPSLVPEFAARISPQRFRHEVYRRAYERVVETEGLRDAADVFSACADDEEVLGVLSSLAALDRSSTIRYGDAAERRAHLERIAQRLEIEDDEARYRELQKVTDELWMAGKPIPEQTLSELSALAAKLKTLKK